MLRRGRFGDLVRRQLDLFAADETSLLDDAAAADEVWTGAPGDETEERYGEYQLVVDTIAERLYDLRETYAATLDERAADEYRAAFTKAARKRFRRYAALLEE